MSDSILREKVVIIEQTDRHGHFHQSDYVTVKIRFWHHYIPRASLTIVDGLHKSEEIDKAIMKAETRKETEVLTGSKRTRYFSFACRAEDLLEFARKIVEIHEAESTH